MSNKDTEINKFLEATYGISLTINKLSEIIHVQTELFKNTLEFMPELNESIEFEVISKLYKIVNTITNHETKEYISKIIETYANENGLQLGGKRHKRKRTTKKRKH